MRIGEFEAALAGGRLAAYRTVYLAIGTGIGAFWGLVLGLYYLRSPSAPAGPQDFRLLKTLSAAHLAAAVAAWAAGPILERALSAAASRAPAGAEAVGAVFRAKFIRLAILEGPAWLGLTACLLGVLSGAIRERPLYWLNTLSSGALIVYVLRSRPTTESFLEAFRAAQGAA